MSYILAEHYPNLKNELTKAIDEATASLKRMLDRYASGDVYPSVYENGRYRAVKQADISNNFWEEGFWTGRLWLAYEATGDEAFRDLADKNVDDFYKRVVENNNIDWHHDTGFLYTPSCVAGYMLTGNPTAKKAAELAAYSLSRRFRYKGRFIQSMLSEIDEDKEFYRFIVDTLLNLPLLFWAAKETGDASYREKAEAHIQTTLRYAMREDGTTFHHVLMDNHTGEMIRGMTWQGAGDNSCWSRGQAWVVYGLALAYGHTQNQSLLEPFYKVTDYFIDHLPEDGVPYWDFVFTTGDDEPRDSSAAAAAVCGILEMAKHLPSDNENMKRYLDAAAKMLHGLISTCAVPYEAGEEGLLDHATGAKPQGMDVDTCITIGDYYYLEALMRATRDWKSYW